MEGEFGIILAGGIGARFGSSVPKQYMKLNGREIISYSIDAFRESRLGENFILVCNEAEFKAQNIARKYGVTCIQGGTTRNESIDNGLKYVKNIIPKPKKSLFTTACGRFFSLGILPPISIYWMSTKP